MKKRQGRGAFENEFGEEKKMKRHNKWMALALSVSMLFTSMGSLPAQAAQKYAPARQTAEAEAPGRTVLNFNSDWGLSLIHI